MTPPFRRPSELLLLSPRPDTDESFDELRESLTGSPFVPGPVRVVHGYRLEEADPRDGAALVAGGGEETLRLLRAGPRPSPGGGEAEGWSWFHLMSSGPDHMVDWGPLPGDPLVTYSRGVNARAVAEWVLAAILHFYRDLNFYTRGAGSTGWNRRWARELSGQRVNIVGAGAAGTELCRILSGLGMEVYGVNRTGKWDCGEGAVPMDMLHRAWGSHDITVILLPLTDETRGLIDEAMIRELNPESLLVVASRGGIVDEEAVLRAVKEERLRGAAFDVFQEEPLPDDSPLRGDPRILLTPHVAGTTDRFMDRTFAVLTEICRAQEPRGGDLRKLKRYRYRLDGGGGP